jgi:hypothetical protein
LDNLLVLVDNSKVLGYTVSSELYDVVRYQHPSLFKIILNRITEIKQAEDTAMGVIVEYARLVNRLPVYVYHTGFPKTSKQDDVVYLHSKMPVNIDIKLLVSMSSLMIGSKKQSWLGNAEKVIYIE